MGRPLKPKASFIIPCYNIQTYLAEAVDSCLRQTERRIEVVLVDDGSTDATPDIIRYYAAEDPRVRAIFFDKNKGRSAARNAGCVNAKTDILMMMDSDDIALPSRAADTINAFDKNHNLDIIYGKFHIIDTLGNIQVMVDAKPFDFEDVKRTGLCRIGHSTMAFRRRVFDAVKYNDGEVSQHGIDDWDFQVRAHKAGFKFGSLPKILAQYRWLPKKRNEERIKEIKDACLAS